MVARNKDCQWHVGANCVRPYTTEKEISLPLSPTGKIIDREINRIHGIYKDVRIEKYVIMPNHIHMIILIEDLHTVRQTENTQGTNCRGRTNTVRPYGTSVSTEISANQPPTISRIIKQFKGSITKQIGYSIWQKLFHDRIIRDDEEYCKIWKYIDENPIKWQDDCYYEESERT